MLKVCIDNITFFILNSLLNSANFNTDKFQEYFISHSKF